MKTETFKRYFTLFVICLGTGVIFKVAYLREAFYGPLQHALNINNEQIGDLSSIYGLVALISYFPGGILADRLSSKHLMVFSFIGTGLLSLWYATLPSYETVKIIYALMGFTTIGTFWAAFIKSIRILGKDQQGQFFGLSEGIRGVSGTIFSFIVLAIIANSASQLAGFQTTLTMYGILYILVGIFCIFALSDLGEKTDDNEKEKPAAAFKFSDVIKVMKIPGLWIVTAIIFFWYIIYNAMSYTTPYLTDIFALPLSIVGTIGIVRSYLIAIFAGPLAGMLSDKIKSPSRLLRNLSVLSALILCGFLIMPADHSLVAIPVTLTILLSVMVFAARGNFFAMLSEAGIPLAYTGVATGFISILAYSPDIFIYSLIGRILDENPGIAGYKITFAIMLGCAVMAFVSASFMLWRKKVKSKQQEMNNTQLADQI